MIPLSRKNEKTIGRKTLRGSDHISRGQNAVFFSVFCGDVLRFFYCTKSDGAERGEHRNMSKQLLKPWCAWNRMCRTNHIFSDTKENAKQKTKNNCLKDNWNIKAPFPCQMHVLCFVLSACQLHYKNGKKQKSPGELSNVSNTGEMLLHVVESLSSYGWPQMLTSLQA